MTSTTTDLIAPSAWNPDELLTSAASRAIRYVREIGKRRTFPLPAEIAGLEQLGGVAGATVQSWRCSRTDGQNRLRWNGSLYRWSVLRLCNGRSVAKALERQSAVFVSQTQCPVSFGWRFWAMLVQESALYVAQKKPA